MIEKLVNSKTRLKILKLFLSHIDDRYYLRELERLLDESLSPLRRQLVKLTNIGILITEDEANLKYYRLNRNFEGLEELKRIVLDQKVLDSVHMTYSPDRSNNIGNAQYPYVRSNNIGNAQYPYVRSNSIGGSIQYSSSGHGSMAQEHSREEEVTVRRLPKLNRIRYDLAVLSFVSVFVLITAIFVVYANNKNIKQVVRLISKETVLDSASVIYSPDRSNNISAKPRSTVSASNGEMTSKKWKVIPGNIPVLSNVETGEEKNSKEL